MKNDEIFTDDVEHPDHYTSGKFECIDVIEDVLKCNFLAGGSAFCCGNVIKYIWRFNQKNGIEDLQKAKWYLERLIQEYSKEAKE